MKVKKNTQKYCGIRKYTYLCPKSLAKRHGITMQLPEPQAFMQGGEGDLLVHAYKRLTVNGERLTMSENSIAVRRAECRYEN